MASLKTSVPIKGFTLLEILLALAILTIIFSFGLVVSFDFYKSHALQMERSNIVTALQKTRSRALYNINQVSHGVRFQATSLPEYVIFECPANNPKCGNYTSNPLETKINSYFGISFLPPTPTLPFDIIFEQLSGKCLNCQNPETIIKTSNGTISADIKISQEGRIDW